MVSIIKQEIEIEEALKKKLEFIGSFCNSSVEIENGSISRFRKRGTLWSKTQSK